MQRLVAEGWDVTVLHRAASDLRYLGRRQARRAAGHVTDAAAVRAALPQACDTVCHVAGNTNLWRRRNAEQTRDNVEGTRNVVDACIAKGVRRLVVTSSISAHGPVSGAVTEDTPSLAATSRIDCQKTECEAQEIARLLGKPAPARETPAFVVKAAAPSATSSAASPAASLR